MSAAPRANIVSSFTVIKGAMIDETYAVFAAWDFTQSKRANLDHLREENFVGARPRGQSFREGFPRRGTL